MSEWMRTDVDFEQPMALLTLSARTAKELKVFDHVRWLAGRPADAQQWLQEMIVRHWPQFAGGVLLGIRFNWPANRWEFSYSHSSFRTPAPGAMLDEQSLDLAPMNEFEQHIQQSLPAAWDAWVRQQAALADDVRPDVEIQG